MAGKMRNPSEAIVPICWRIHGNGAPSAAGSGSDEAQGNTRAGSDAVRVKIGSIPSIDAGDR
jgi:hypothetical protein